MHKKVIFQMLNLGMPPSVNNAYAQSGRKRILSLDAKSWYEYARLMLNIERKKQEIRLIDFKIEMDATFYFKNPKRCDTSNYVKLLWDSLIKAEVILDDSLIWKETITKDQTLGMPYVDFNIYQYEEIKCP